MGLGKNNSSFLQYDRISFVENYKVKKKSETSTVVMGEKKH